MVQPARVPNIKKPVAIARLLGAVLVLALGICLMIPAAPALAADGDAVILLSPADGAEVIAKKPPIRFKIRGPLAGRKLLVVLDDTDITAVLTASAQGYAYSPIRVLAAGKHTLTVKLTAPDGKETEDSFSFTIRHTGVLREAYGEGELTAVYQGKLHRTSESSDPPGSSIETNLSGDITATEGNWKMGFKFNLRYLDQSTPVAEPLSKGVNMADYLLDLKYTRGEFGLLTQIGDVVINESDNTASNLARRGGRFAASYQGLSLSVFSVNSAQYYGFYGGLGISNDSDEHIYGAVARLSLWSETAEVKLIYLTGGEIDPGVGESDSGDRRRGSVYGLVFKTNFFEDRLITDFEIDFSRYNPADEEGGGPYNDRAFRLGAEGKWSSFFYGGKYQYFGRDYAVVGNSDFEGDRSGYSFFGGAEFTSHTFQVTYSRFRDNVESDDEMPVTRVHEFGVEYSYTGIENYTASLGYTYAVNQTSREPAETAPADSHAHTLTHTSAYLGKPWAVEFTASYSHQYDRTDDQGNTIVLNFSLSPSYTSERFSVVPTVSYDRSTTEVTDVHTETWTVNLDIRGNLDKIFGFPEGSLTYGLTGSYSRVRASDDSAKTDTTSAALEVSYLLGENVWPGMKPSVGLRVRYDRMMDYQSGEGDEEFSVFLVLQTSIPYSF